MRFSRSWRTCSCSRSINCTSSSWSVGKFGLQLSYLLLTLVRSHGRSRCGVLELMRSRQIRIAIQYTVSRSNSLAQLRILLLHGVTQCFQRRIDHARQALTRRLTCVGRVSTVIHTHRAACYGRLLALFSGLLRLSYTPAHEVSPAHEGHHHLFPANGIFLNIIRLVIFALS